MGAAPIRSAASLVVSIFGSFFPIARKNINRAAIAQALIITLAFLKPQDEKQRTGCFIDK
jgi:hypothetical protein